MDRVEATLGFYALLDELERHIGGRRRVADATGWMRWPTRGVYFFFEPGERRSGSGAGSRVVRVGTHALKAGSGTTLWGRLRQHRGTLNPPGGNHRGSIFRKLVGDAMTTQTPSLRFETWGRKDSASRAVRDSERPLECLVSQRIGDMSVVFLPVEDEPGRDSLRGFIERNAIALLSGYVGAVVQPPSPGWLGRHSTRERVRRSGLWNNNHVDESVDSIFHNVFRDLVNEASRFLE